MSVDDVKWFASFLGGCDTVTSNPTPEEALRHIAAQLCGDESERKAFLDAALAPKSEPEPAWCDPVCEQLYNELPDGCQQEFAELGQDTSGCLHAFDGFISPPRLIWCNGAVLRWCNGSMKLYCNGTMVATPRPKASHVAPKIDPPGAHGAQILGRKSRGPHPGAHILGPQSWGPNPGAPILGPQSWCPCPGVSIMVPKSWGPNPGAQGLGPKSWGPNFGGQIRRPLGPQSWGPNPGAHILGPNIMGLKSWGPNPGAHMLGP